MNRFWHRIKLFFLFWNFGLPIKEAWKDSGELVAEEAIREAKK